jgi:hypothetical protein
MAGSFAEQNKAATCRAAPTAGADGDLDPALLSTICWRFGVPNGPRFSSNTLSKSAGLGSPRFKRGRDLGRLSSTVPAERLRM